MDEPVFSPKRKIAPDNSIDTNQLRPLSVTENKLSRDVQRKLREGATIDLQGITERGATSDQDIVLTGSLSVDNINITGNTIGTTNTNGDLVIDNNGTGGIDFVGSGAASRVYINSLGQMAINGGTPGSELFYMTNTDTGISRASMVFAAESGSQFAIYEMRDIVSGNNWKMATSGNTGHVRFTYNDTIKGYLSNEGKLRLTNGSTAVASARLHLEEDVSNAEILRYDCVVGTGTPRNIIRGHLSDIVTTDATATTIVTIAAATASRGYKLTVEAWGRVTSGAAINEVVQIQKNALFKNVSGTVTQVGSTTTLFSNLDTSLGAANLTFAISGTDINIQVTGIASNTINWRTFYTWSLF